MIPDMILGSQWLSFCPQFDSRVMIYISSVGENEEYCAHQSGFIPILVVVVVSVQHGMSEYGQLL